MLLQNEIVMKCDRTQHGRAVLERFDFTFSDVLLSETPRNKGRDAAADDGNPGGFNVQVFGSV
jgi:hypothetical protein